MANLLPPQYKHSILRMYRTRFVALTLVGLMLLALIGALFLLPSYFLSRNTQAVLVQKVATLNSHETSGLETSLSTSIADINTRLGVFSTTAPDSPVIASFIDPVLAAKMSSVHISSFSYAPDPKNPKTAKVQIEGDADSREALLSFADSLRSTPGVVSVDVPIESFIKDSDVTFSISAVATLK